MKRTIFAACFAAAVMMAHGALAGQASTPAPNQKFFSLQASRNLAAAKKPAVVAAPRFFDLKRHGTPRMIPLGKAAAKAAESGNKITDTELSAAPHKTLPGSLSSEQAHQLLSLFAEAD